MVMTAAAPLGRPSRLRLWRLRCGADTSSAAAALVSPPTPACGSRDSPAKRLWMDGPRRALTTLRAAAGPTPAWDTTGAAAVEPLADLARDGNCQSQVKLNSLNRVIWMCWTGHNPIPAHLRLCLKTVERNSGLPVILVTPQNVLRYVPDPHPAYEFLHLQHRADYLRCCLLHFYGGIYLDMDTICLRDLTALFDQLTTFDAVGYDGSQWGELIGISDMGPFRPRTKLTDLWFNALHAKLHQCAQELQARNTYPFYWQEILRDIFVPSSLIHRRRISTALQAYNPDADMLLSCGRDAGGGHPALTRELELALESAHVLILNNSKYGKNLAELAEDDVLGGY
eukprot:TRINITY_DN7405_c1_g1_i3.p1 TRINITY_DN7405_c1_g1~~TRINITY_DN7405_c1_g1_i3.p1  ORF type:complete len:351 (+),score=57.41 TRINITY_DN7405_c1_g1_i3:33-1055(+)